LTKSGEMISTRRLYDPEEPGEHYKVLIDRLWPRGVLKEKAGWNEWIKEIAPSTELRQWFHHNPDRWDQFKQLYRKELAQKNNELSRLRQLEKEHRNLALLYAAKDKEHNNAIVLMEYLVQNEGERNGV